MIRIDVYRYGAGIRARLHDHQAGPDEPCTEQCEEYSQQRAYPDRGSSPAEQRQHAVAAVQRAMVDRAIGHAFFVQMLNGDERLL